MKHKIVILILLFVSFVNAQEEKKEYSFTLQEAINYAIQNNYKAINAGRDIEAAKQKKWETTASGLPQINGTVGYQNNIVIQKSVVPAEFFGGNPGEFAEVEFGTKHNMNASASLSQLIFDGSYIVALQASKTYLQYYQNYKVKTDNDIREMVTNYYGNVLLAKENIAILEKNKATLEKNLFDAQETYKNGLIEEESVEQLQITLASISSSLSNTTRLIDISTKMLKITLGLDIEDQLTLTENLDDLTAKKVDLTFGSDSFNVQNNIEYQIAENFKEQRRLEYKLQRAAYLPTLSATANFGYNTFSNEFTFLQQDQKWFNFSTIGVNLNVPIFSSFGKRAKSQQAKIALEQAETQLTEAEQMLKLQFESAKSDYEYSIEQYATSKSNLKLAERIENKQQIKFKEGLSTSFEFTEAQRQLYSAQQSYLQSMIDVINKKTTLDKITNQQ
ncbi:TolC family protein [Flavobacterium jejuense]|uniref:TolC family protein n=1 Tax=Flavobacterium jejuense TaxID=1544455 RepID=A0ABX0IZ28_9FLAO|nr:TolC family protein [Flavobacterium jejuense]NHN26970.1 TolC family protein [Flavobacterium jejuense]